MPSEAWLNGIPLYNIQLSSTANPSTGYFAVIIFSTLALSMPSILVVRSSTSFLVTSDLVFHSLYVTAPRILELVVSTFDNSSLALSMASCLTSSGIVKSLRTSRAAFAFISMSFIYPSAFSSAFFLSRSIRAISSIVVFFTRVISSSNSLMRLSRATNKLLDLSFNTLIAFPQRIFISFSSFSQSIIFLSRRSFSATASL